MPRTLEQAWAMWSQMLPLRRAGYDLIPLAARRTPWTGWRHEDYSEFAFVDHLKAGGAVGVRLGDEHLVVDVDPRNGGDDSLLRLTFDIGEDLDRDGVPSVRSGGGGLHLYLRKPPGRTRVTLPKLYGGIDFKRVGGYVVAPGNDHPSGGTYRWIRPLSAQGVPGAPEALLALLTRPPAAEPATGPVDASTAVLTPDQLATLLAVVDASQYGQGRYEEWLALSMACHAATSGTGFEEWADWCASDDAYSDVTVEELRDRWDSFALGRGITHRTLFKAVSDAGHRDVLRAIENEHAFDDEHGVEADFAFPAADVDFEEGQ